MKENSRDLSEGQVASYWDESADSWTEQVRKGLDTYREYVNNPAFFQFVGNLRGRKVLDAGCGEGRNTRIMATMGAAVVGIDVSPRLVERARGHEETEPLGIEYHVASFTDLSAFQDASFDVVISTMALNDSPNFGKAIREFYRVLCPGGELIFSIEHPCFVTKGVGWIKDEGGNDSKLTVSDYFDERPQLQEWKFSYAPSDTRPFVTPAFFRTLSGILKTLIGAGFVLKDIEEPRPSEEACARFPRMEKWRKHAALFLYVRCEKPCLKKNDAT